MALNIKHPEADKLARTLANKTGETITEAVIQALRERLMREKGRRTSIQLKDELLEIGHRCAGLPDLDIRTPNEIIGYDEHGLPR